MARYAHLRVLSNRVQYGLSRSRQRFLCRSPRSGRESQPASPACRVPAAIRQFSSGRGSICRLTPNTPCQPLIFCVARSPRRRRSAAASFPSGAVRTGVSSAYSRCACPFSGLVMVSVGAGAFRSLQSMAAPVRSTSNPSQNMACGWLNWMYSPEWRVFPAMRTPKCKSSEKYGLCGKRSLKSSSTALFNVPCAYGGLLSGTFHVLISFQGFGLALVIMRSAKI